MYPLYKLLVQNENRKDIRLNLKISWIDQETQSKVDLSDDLSNPET